MVDQQILRVREAVADCEGMEDEFMGARMKNAVCKASKAMWSPHFRSTKIARDVIDEIESIPRVVK
jgi:hypothetical protein